MKFTEALELMRHGLSVRHETWDAGSRMWHDSEDDVFRVGTKWGSWVWMPKPHDLMSRGWEQVLPRHELVLWEEAAEA